MQVSSKIIRLVCMTLCSARARCKIQGLLTREFEVRRGLRQGVALSKTLLNFGLELIIRKVPHNQRGTICTSFLQTMDFPDDVVLIGRNTRALIEALPDTNGGWNGKRKKFRTGELKMGFW